jgi:hypothetical protein
MFLCKLTILNFHCFFFLHLTEEWEAKRAARHVETEDPIKRKHREADLMKQKKMEQFQKQAADHHESKHLDLAEQQLRERVRFIPYHPEYI